jgi:hypothetical protein
VEEGCGKNHLQKKTGFNTQKITSATLFMHKGWLVACLMTLEACQQVLLAKLVAAADPLFKRD